jgi:hypothetical protein
MWIGYHPSEFRVSQVSLSMEENTLKTAGNNADETWLSTGEEE